MERVIRRKKNPGKDASGKPGDRETLPKSGRAYKVLAAISLIALALQSSLLFLALFEKPLPYSIAEPGPEAIDSPEFMRAVAALSGGTWYANNRLDVFTNGDQFYQAEMEAIRSATRFVHIECYVFEQGRVTDRLIEALEERARAGVRVNMVIDAIGSATFPRNRLDKLHEAGGRVAFYHPMRWYTWPRLNNRTHRVIVVVDGRVGFAGGAGFSDQWLLNEESERRWRDTMVRVEGDAVTGLQGTFAENWLEAHGEILAAPAFYPSQQGGGQTKALVVSSSPSRGRSTEARILFQSLIAKASRNIHITTPYFLPDESLRMELAKAVRERKVEVMVLTPGVKSDQHLTRSSSRQLYGDLLLAGARIFEYRPAMVHAKTLMVDGKWAVVGSTNLDARSFGINDEINVAVPDSAVVARLEQDFARDLKTSHEIRYEEWKRRPVIEKVSEWFGWLLQNQQ